MMQLYFLSVLINLLAGFSLLFCEKKDCHPALQILQTQNFKLITGILACLISVITLFNPAQIIIIGDFIPSVTGIFGGFSLLYSFYVDKRSLDVESKHKKFENFIMENRKYFGVTCLIAALLHFIFPNVVVL